MTMDAARLRKDAFDSSIRLPTTDIVRELQDILGAKLVAYIAGAGETSTVRDWVDGTLKPDAIVETVLRHAYRVSMQIAQRESEAIVPVWFQGMNPLLDDRSPARVLRDGEFEQVAPQVLAAADNFVGD